MIIRPGHNVWRVDRAARAAVLVDAAAYFGAVRAALLRARSSVFIIGWDIDSRTPLRGEEPPDDGWPETLVGVLARLIDERPQVTVHLLLWDYSVLYALERELFPVVALRWKTPRQVRLCLDDALPLGASHHQKIVVVDDAVAFSGGLDLTIRRWDTSQHRLDDPRRLDPAGKPYRPFHDVQAMVDGPAAQALATLARERWARGACERPRPIAPAGDPWPDHVRPDFTDVDVAIARTDPGADGRADIREVAALFHDSIAAAERSIYIENQFLTCAAFAERLAQRMRERPYLETLIVAPQNHESWIEARTMRNGRIRFMRILQEAGVGDRVRLLYPEVRDGDRVTDTMIHSKVMVVDDRFLRVGSANLNNRSMGTDTECDLAIEAATDRERAAIAAVRDRLIADHCGVAPEVVSAALARTGSLLAVAQQVGEHGHRLQPVDDGPPDPDDLTVTLEGVADPERPIAPEAFLEQMLGAPARRVQWGRLAKILLAAFVVVGLALAWQYTPLAAFTDPDRVREAFDWVAREPTAPLIVLSAFVVGGILAFPVTLLIAATAAAFGPWLGFAYAAAGALASALVTYGIGATLGRETLQDYLGPRLNRIRRSIARRGIIAVAAVRLVPIAPFTLVNLVAGASQIKLQDYMIGTALGLAPGLIVMSALGSQIVRILAEPTWANVLLLVGAVVVWIAISLALQLLVSKLRSADA